MPERIPILRHRIASRLREIRVARGLSQRDLALAAGVAAAQISRWEAGAADIPFPQAVMLMDALDCWSVDLLVPPGSKIPPRRARLKRSGPTDVRGYYWDDPLDHLAAIWNELRVEIHERRGVDIGRQPADDWIEAIREHMGICECPPAEHKRRQQRIIRRMEAYHAQGLE